MFRDTRRKKLKDRVILVSLGLLVMAFGLWLNMREPADDGSVKAVDRLKLNRTVAKMIAI